MVVLDMSYKLASNPVYLITKHAYFIVLDICIRVVSYGRPSMEEGRISTRCKMPPESLPFLENLRRGATWARTIFDGFVRVVVIANADIVALGSVEIVNT
jgi:hypothetical protein